MKKLFLGAAVFVVAVGLCLTGCPTSNSGDPTHNAAQEAAEAFETAHAGVLDKTAGTVTTADEAAVNAALTAYETLSADAKTLLGEKKALLDSLKTGIDTLKNAGAFETAHAGALGKTVETVAIADEAAVNAALTAWEALSVDAKALLGEKKSLLDSLKIRIDALTAATAPEAAEAFETAHAGALSKTVETVTTADENAVNAALTAWEALSANAKALLGEQKALLDSLKTRIDALIAEMALKAAEAFETAHAGILGKTVTDVTKTDEAAVKAALTAWETLSAATKALLGEQKTLLDNLKARIDAIGGFDLGLGGEDPIITGQGLANGTVTLSRDGDPHPQQLTLGVTKTYGSYQWIIGRVTKSWTAALEIDAADYSPGSHSVSVVVYANGVPYSSTVTVVVTE
jgi:hypothetical protein